MKAILFGFILVFALPLSANTVKVLQPTSSQTEIIQNGIVRVTVSSVRTDALQPWVRRPTDAYTVTGLYLGHGLILVQADDIRNAALIEVSRANSYDRGRARFVLIDMEINLAILKIEDSDFLGDLKPLPIGQDPVQGDEINAVKPDSLFRIYNESVTVIEYTISSDYGFTKLPVFIFSGRESYQNGDILLKQGRLTGLVAYQRQQGKTVAIPISRISAFRDRALKSIQSNQTYTGFVVQGIELEELVDPQLRKYLGVDGLDKNHGALVGSVLPGTPSARILKAGDVLLRLDGQDIDKKGLYKDPLLGLQRAELLLTRDLNGRYRNAGETISAVVLRDRKQIDFELNLIDYQGTAERIPWLQPEKEPPYLVESGLVFLELTVPYLQSRFGKDWRHKAIELAYIYDTKKNFGIDDDRDKIIILSEVLPDPVNVGYQNLGALVLESVNGQKVKSLQDLIKKVTALRNQPSGFVEMSFTDGTKVFLDVLARAENERIRQTYHLPVLSR
ncbi:MAG: hypothetical protein H3C43_04215 [Leptonema sp. (in: Bacteria)]|nr:hypothetical protein [Leptonema sp. (in: bacteria)]